MGPEKQKGLFQPDPECLLPHAVKSVLDFLKSTSGMSKPVESPEKQLYRDEEEIQKCGQNLQKGVLELSQECLGSLGAVPAAGMLVPAEEGGETSLAACVPAAESLSGPRGVEGTALSPLGGYGRVRPDPERSGTSTGTAALAPRLPGVGLEPQLSVNVTSAVTQPQPQLQTPPAAPPPGQPSSGAPVTSQGGVVPSLHAQPGARGQAGGETEPWPAPSAAAALLKLNSLCNTAAAEQQQPEKTTASPPQIDLLDTTQSQESFEHSRGNAQFCQSTNPPTDMDTGLRDISVQSPTSLEWFQKNSRKAKIKSIVRCIAS
ncbi:uncharacterized protein LOC131586212 [Poecile atricapillus]|uniref:uncharacterized protein LOC131586212 n=1 Tax=Poecile atricapillus TaxID=48891 RepID=UPI0027399D5F|nr:uncharacterized protein LOC131586212 [Poecile atricapillus]